MDDRMNALAMIHARGGSKRLPGKNLVEFCGRPLVSYPIAAALESGLFAEVMVSTDDDRIAQVARHYGAEVPFMRSEWASGDEAMAVDVCHEVLRMYGLANREFDAFCVLHGCQPFIRPDLLQAAAELLGRFDVVRAVIRRQPVEWALHLAEDGRIEPVHPTLCQARSQDCEPAYSHAGMLYWVKTAAFEREKTLFPTNSGAIVLREDECHDIDEPEDLVMAELKYARLHPQTDEREIVRLLTADGREVELRI